MLKSLSVAALLLLVVGAVDPAAADSGNGLDTNTTTVSGTQTDDGGAAFVDSIIGRHGRTPRRGGSSGIVCRYHTLDPLSPIGGTGPVATTVTEGQLVWRTCTDANGATVSGEFVTIGPQDPRAQAMLAVARAIADLSIELPVADSSPANHLTVPNIATWFWVENTAPQSSTASVGGVAATVRAEFTGATFQAGDQSVDCADGGRAYDLDLPDDRQHSACTIRFTPPARHLDVDVTAAWHLTWTATNGQRGDLGDVDRTATIGLDVHELHTVIRNT